jgi:hypothetical protein
VKFVAPGAYCSDFDCPGKHVQAEVGTVQNSVFSAAGFYIVFY